MRRLALGLAGLAVAAALAGCGPEPVQIPTSEPTMGSYEPHRAHPPVTPTLSASPASTPPKAATTTAAVMLGEPCGADQVGETAPAKNGEWYVCLQPEGGGTLRWALP